MIITKRFSKVLKKRHELRAKGFVTSRFNGSIWYKSKTDRDSMKNPIIIKDTDND